MIRSFLCIKFFFLFLILSFNFCAQEKFEFSEITLKEYESNYSTYKNQELFSKYSCSILNHSSIDRNDLNDILNSFESIVYLETFEKKVDIFIRYTGNNKCFSEIEKTLKSNNILIERNKNVSIVIRQKNQ